MANVQNEIWVDAPGFERFLQVSNKGRIAVKPRIIMIRGREANYARGKVFYGAINKQGYMRVSIRENGRVLNAKVHRLVASAFIPNPNNKPSVNHINGIKTDNRVENLEWCTVKENWEHARLFLGHSVTGERNPKAKITETQAREIFIDPRIQIEIAAAYGVAQTTVSLIKRRKAWNHVTAHL